MKKVRCEHAVNAAGNYLKRRQYTESDTFKKNELKLSQSLQELALLGAMTNESSEKNVICYSSINRDVTAIDQQFTRLKSFVSEAIEPYKSELTHILFPVFVHLYLELVKNGQKTPAQKFRNRHQGLFADVAEYKGTIEGLVNVSTGQDPSKYPSVKVFRENKYTVRLSEDVFDYLLRFLRGNNHLILLQILNLHIEIKVQNTEKNNLHLYEDRLKSNTKVGSKIGAETKAETASESELRSLESAIQKVKEGPPNQPSICLYTFTNTFQGLSSVCLSNDISLVAGGYEDSAIRLWSLTPAPLVSTGIASGVSRVRLACDYDTCYFDRDPTKSNAYENNNEIRLQNETVLDANGCEMKTMRAHSGPVYGVSFVPDFPLLLSCSEDTTVRAWSTESHSNVTLYRGHNYPVWDIDCSAIGSYFATASQDRTAKLWYLDRTYPVRIFAGHEMDVDCVKFHPNASYVATGSSDKSVRLWNVQEGKMVRIFQGHRGTIFALAFSPNGQFLASAGEDRRIRIWDLGAGTMLKELRGHIDTVYSLCFSRDNSSLASGGLDGTIRLWDTRKGVAAANPADNHTSPELLCSYPAKSVGLHLLHYSLHNLLVAVGARQS